MPPETRMLGYMMIYAGIWGFAGLLILVVKLF